MIELRGGLRVEIRPATGKDLNYVTSATANSYKHGCRDAARILDRGAREMLIRRRLAEAVDPILVAVAPDAPDVIMGFVWAAPRLRTLYYVYVNELYRHNGLARALLESVKYETANQHNEDWLCVHWTRDFSNFAAKHQSLYWRL